MVWPQVQCFLGSGASIRMHWVGSGRLLACAGRGGNTPRKPSGLRMCQIKIRDLEDGDGRSSSRRHFLQHGHGRVPQVWPLAARAGAVFFHGQGECPAGCHHHEHRHAGLLASRAWFWAYALNPRGCAAIVFWLPVAQEGESLAACTWHLERHAGAESDSHCHQPEPQLGVLVWGKMTPPFFEVPFERFPIWSRSRLQHRDHGL